MESSWVACALGSPWKYGIISLKNIPESPIYKVFILIRYTMSVFHFYFFFTYSGSCALCYGWIWNLFGFPDTLFWWCRKWMKHPIQALKYMYKFNIIELSIKKICNFHLTFTAIICRRKRQMQKTCIQSF